MKPLDMLSQMCRVVLADTDVKALCKARGLSPQATSSRGILETLFLSPQGVSNVFNSLDRNEVALLHLLKNYESPVGVAFFPAPMAVSIPTARSINATRTSLQKLKNVWYAAACCCGPKDGKTRVRSNRRWSVGGSRCRLSFIVTCRR